MLISMLLLAASDVQPASRVEFVEQARKCSVSLEYEPRAEQSYAASLSRDGKVLYLRDNRPKEQVDCMLDWAAKRHLMVIRARH